MKRFTEWLLLLAALLVPVLPAFAQEGVAVVAAETAADGVIWWIALLLAVVIVVLVAAVIALLRERARAGDAGARQALRFFEDARDMLPLEQVQALIQQAEARARMTSTPVDDLVTELIRRGYQVIAPPAADGPQDGKGETL